MKHTLLIMAGGTGGHVFPGIAVADYMRSLGWRVVWLGTQNGMEAVLVPKYGYPVEYINFSGIRRKRIMDWLLLPGKLLLAFWQSIKILIRNQPSIVLGMGGYPAFPGGFSAFCPYRATPGNFRNTGSRTHAEWRGRKGEKFP